MLYPEPKFGAPLLYPKCVAPLPPWPHHLAEYCQQTSTGFMIYGRRPWLDIGRHSSTSAKSQIYAGHATVCPIPWHDQQRGREPDLHVRTAQPYQHAAVTSGAHACLLHLCLGPQRNSWLSWYFSNVRSFQLPDHHVEAHWLDHSTVNHHPIGWHSAPDTCMACLASVKCSDCYHEDIVGLSHPCGWGIWTTVRGSQLQCQGIRTTLSGDQNYDVRGSELRCQEIWTTMSEDLSNNISLIWTTMSGDQNNDVRGSELWCQGIWTTMLAWSELRCQGIWTTMSGELNNNVRRSEQQCQAIWTTMSGDLNYDVRGSELRRQEIWTTMSEDLNYNVSGYELQC